MTCTRLGSCLCSECAPMRRASLAQLWHEADRQAAKLSQAAQSPITTPGATELSPGGEDAGSTAPPPPDRG